MSDQPARARALSRREFLRSAAVAAAAVAVVPVLQACSSGGAPAGGATPAAAGATPAAAGAAPTSEPAPAPTVARVIPGATAAPAAASGGKQLTLLIESAF